MTERRIDPYTGRSVLIAPGRRGIGAAKPGGLPEPVDGCPFCPGHEADAERTILTWPDEGAWRVRVVGNKHPIVDDAFAGGGAAGIHEVVIEAREHSATLATLDVQGVMRVVRTRIRALTAEPSIAAVFLFRNQGRRAGSSQPHPHSQIVATGWVPYEVALRWRVAEEHLRAHGEPLHVAELRRELGSARELVLGNHVATFCPYAPSRPFEVRFSPLAPAGDFGAATDEEIDELAAHLQSMVSRLDERTSVRDFNLVLREPPVGASGPAAAWHLELLPRTGGDAGFELATHEMVVVVTPEQAARTLRG